MGMVSCKPCEALREVTCEILTKNESDKKTCEKIIDRFFLGEIDVETVANALGASVENVMEAVQEAVKRVKQMFKLDVKLDCEISSDILEKMAEALKITAETGREAGFIVCGGQVSPIYVGTRGMVIHPSCAGEREISFHTHPSGQAEFSAMDIISAIASDTKLECVGADGTVVCVNLSKIPSDIKLKIRKAYEEWLRSLPDLSEATVRANLNKLYESVRYELESIINYISSCKLEVS